MAREVYHPFTITGKSDGRVAIRHGKSPSSQKLEYDITAHLHQGYVNHTESDYPLEKVEAQIHLTNDRFTLHTLEAQHDSSTIKMAGHLSDPNDYRLHVETQNLHMDQPLRKLVQQVKPELWDMLSFSGDMNLLLDIEQTHALTTPLITGTLEPINASLRLAIIDYPFENIQGKIIIDPNRLIFDQIQGEINSGHFSFSGLWPRNWHDLIELQFQADKIVINDAFLAALPESMTDYFQRIELEGQLKTDLKVSGQNDPDKKGLWNVNGSIQLHQGKIISPMLSETIDLLWKGSLSYQSQTETLWAEGDFQEGSALIKKRPLEKFQAKMAYNNESNILQLSDIKAEFCEGLLGGNAQVSLPKDGPGYELQLVIRDADLKLFLESEKPIQNVVKNFKGVWKANTI